MRFNKYLRLRKSKHRIYLCLNVLKLKIRDTITHEIFETNSSFPVKYHTTGKI